MVGVAFLLSTLGFCLAFGEMLLYYSLDLIPLDFQGLSREAAVKPPLLSFSLSHVVPLNDEHDVGDIRVLHDVGKRGDDSAVRNG